MTLPAAPVSPSAIASLDVPEIIASGTDPFLPFTVAVLTDCRFPVADLPLYFPPSACSAVEAWMAATGSAAVQAAST